MGAYSRSFYKFFTCFSNHQFVSLDCQLSSPASELFVEPGLSGGGASWESELESPPSQELVCGGNQGSVCPEMEAVRLQLGRNGEERCLELLVTGMKQVLLKLGASRKVSEKALNPQSWIQEEQGLEIDTRRVGVGMLCSAWMSKDLDVDQEMKTGKQKGKEAECCCVLLAYLRGELKQVQEALSFLVMCCEAGKGYLWFIRTSRICHHPSKSRGNGNGSCFLS